MRIRYLIERLRLHYQAIQIIRIQDDLLHDAYQEIEVWRERAITGQRAIRDLAVAFRGMQELPEEDFTEELDELIKDLSDSVARLEEHYV